MGLEWSDELRTGIVEIDEQHKELFARVNSLLDACGRGKGRHEVTRLIAFFQEYVMTHFLLEESAMEARGYPDLHMHRAEHEEFAARLAALRQTLSSEGAGVNLVVLTIRASVEWLAHHIRKKDRIFADFVGAKNKSDKMSIKEREP